MPENTVDSRVEELEKIVKDLSEKVGALSEENMVLYRKSKQVEALLPSVLRCCRGIAIRVDALEKGSSTLTQSVEQQGDPLNAASIIREEKSLNTDRSPGEMPQIQVPHISLLLEAPQPKFAPAMEVQGVLNLEPQVQEMASGNKNAELELRMPDPNRRAPKAIQRIDLPESLYGGSGDASQYYGSYSFPKGEGNGERAFTRDEGRETIDAMPTSRKRKAPEMGESGSRVDSLPSSSYGGPITFLNTFSEDMPKKRPARGSTSRARRAKAGVQLMTPPPEPVQEEQGHVEQLTSQVQEGLEIENTWEIQDMEEELQITDEQHMESINALFGNSNNGFGSFKYDGSNYDLFRTGNWVC